MSIFVLRTSATHRQIKEVFIDLSVCSKPKT